MGFTLLNKFIFNKYRLLLSRIWLHDMKKNRMTGWLFGSAVHQCGDLPGDQPGSLLNGETCRVCCPEERFCEFELEQ
ncbi:hypothetical protein AAC387_Pa11g1780 [Persea americana]